MAFLKKRRSGKFEPVSPRTKYTVTYLGREELMGKVGLDNTIKPVDDLYRKYKLKKAKSPSKLAIEIVNNGIRVEPLDAAVRKMFANSPYFVAEGPFGNVFFPINKLSFGAADPFHAKVFCFVSRNDDPSQDGHWDCHAVVCESSAMAKNLTLYLVKAFQKIADAKNDPNRAAQKSKKTTIVHVLQERGTTEHQIAGRKKKGKRPPPVSTLKVTLNVEESYEQIRSRQLDNNRQVADILARQISVDNSEFTDERDGKDNGNTTVSVVMSSSDKENEVMDDVIDETDNGDGGSRDIVVTVAVNPELTPPLDAPRKVSMVEMTSSGEESDRDGSRPTSPQEMITTMSPPDTPGYLSKEGGSPSLPTTHPTPDSSNEAVVRVTASPPSSPTSPKVQVNAPDVALKSASSPKKEVPSVQSSVGMKQSDHRVITPMEAPSTAMLSAQTDSTKETDSVKGVLKRDSPSPPNTPSSSPPSSPTSPTTDQTSTSTNAAAEKKLKRDKRKSVRFAVDDDLIA